MLNEETLNCTAMPELDAAAAAADSSAAMVEPDDEADIEPMAEWGESSAQAEERFLVDVWIAGAVPPYLWITDAMT